jgi:predicted DNA-binding protein
MAGEKRKGGRPARPGLGYVGLRIAPETRKRLQAMAEKDGRSESGMIRVILERFLEAEGDRH